MSLYFTDSVADKRLRYATIAAAMKNDRSSFEAHWRELGDHLLPRRTRFFTGDRNKGDRRTSKIFDSTGRFAVRTLQSGLHAGLTSPARPWMKLTTPDPDLAKVPSVRAWLSVVTQRMMVIFQQTNLYNALPIIYGDMGVFATGCMGIIEDTKDLFRCYTYPIGSYAIGLDQRGLATAFTRDYQLSVRQVIETFALKADGRTIDWSVVSAHVKTCWDKALYEEPIEITWLVCPNPHADKTRFQARFKPWASCHWETAAGEAPFLRESGFNTFPIVAPRWDVTGEDTYGTDCPGMTALPDIKQLMGQQRMKALAIQTLVKPPVTAPTALRTQATTLIPGGITYVDDLTTSGRGMRSVYEININVDHLVNDIRLTQQMIQRAFYEDLFLMLATADNGSSQPITAEEVRERHEEKLLALGPVLERTNDELLEPTIDRVYQMMEAAHLLPPAPRILEGVNIKAEYTSIMAQAQKLVAVVGLDRFVAATSGMIASVAPAMRHKINYNKIADVYGDALGIEEGILRSDDDANADAQAEAQAAQKQAEADQAQKMAAAMKNAGTTPMDGDTALTRMVGGAKAAA